MSTTDTAFIQLHDLSMTYHEGQQQRLILDAVSLDLPKGQFVALLGPSGSGKTTLLNLIAGLDQPDKGQVIVEGKDLTAMTEAQRTRFRREHLGLIFQFFNLLPALTVLENVMLPLQLNQHADPEQAASTLLEAVGLDTRLQTYPGTLSGGEQQRVAIARALSHQPMIILADEPTGNLDQATGEQVMALLLQMVKARQQTLIMVTHNPEIAAQADQVYELLDRQLVLH